MTTEKQIDVIISVRDRNNERIQRCIDSLSGLPIQDVVVVDYGSKEPVDVKCTKLIRYDGNKIWNKSHALNLGIKATKSEYVCTVDCDMIFTQKMKERLIDSLSHENFIYNTNVRRLQVKHISDDYDKMYEKSIPWFGNNRGQIYSKANGGIQCFPRKFIDYIGGYDENLGIYFGAMDNRIYEQASLLYLKTVNLNAPMFHQEHSNKKENNLPPEERELAEFIRHIKAQDLNVLIEQNLLRNVEPWGQKKPNQNKYLDRAKEFLKWQERTAQDKKLFMMGLYEKLQKSKDGKGDITIDGNKHTVTLA